MASDFPVSSMGWGKVYTTYKACFTEKFSPSYFKPCRDRTTCQTEGTSYPRCIPGWVQGTTLTCNYIADRTQKRLVWHRENECGSLLEGLRPCPDPDLTSPADADADAVLLVRRGQNGRTERIFCPKCVAGEDRPYLDLAEASLSLVSSRSAPPWCVSTGTVTTPAPPAGAAPWREAAATTSEGRTAGDSAARPAT